MARRVLRNIAVIAAAWWLGAGVAHAQAPVLSPPIVNGNDVTLNWTATAGATGYDLQYGVASGVYLGSLPLGNTTTFTIPGAPNGIFALRIVATTPGGQVPGNEVIVQVPAPPAAPSNFVVARNGTGIVAAWTPGAGGATADFYQFQIGFGPGQTAFTANVTNAGWGYPGGVPAGTYYARVVAYNNTSGVSAPSNEFVINMPPGGACDAAVSDFNASGFSRILSLSWTPIAGVAHFVSASLDGVPLAANVQVPGNGRFNWGYTGTGPQTGTLPPLGTWDFDVRTVFACGSESTKHITLANIGNPPPGPRAADPAPGDYLRAPENAARAVVNAVAARRPDLLNASCGNNRFMFEVVKELRKLDTRWGLNVKRGYQGLSQDVVAWNGSALPDEGATTGPTGATVNIQIFDVIGGHCGPRPGPNWEDVTGKTLANGDTRAVWTLTYYLDAGYTP
ncbi:MAG: hypothetical protein R2745_04555 [Vicinamibacterales bacterium]